MDWLSAETSALRQLPPLLVRLPRDEPSTRSWLTERIIGTAVCAVWIFCQTRVRGTKFSVVKRERGDCSCSALGSELSTCAYDHMQANTASRCSSGASAGGGGGENCCRDEWTGEKGIKWQRMWPLLCSFNSIRMRVLRECLPLCNTLGKVMEQGKYFIVTHQRGVIVGWPSKRSVIAYYIVGREGYRKWNTE